MSSPRLLFLGPTDSSVLGWLIEEGEDVVQSDAPVTVADVKDFELLVSHGYRHLIRPDVLEHFPRRAVNLHISYLPHNRGADPNFWSWMEGTPKGVTIHLIDPGLDTGDVVARELVELGEDETLRSSYAALQGALLSLFQRTWPLIRSGTFEETPQTGTGSVHRAAEREALWATIPAGWDTPVADLARRRA